MHRVAKIILFSILFVSGLFAQRGLSPIEWENQRKQYLISTWQDIQNTYGKQGVIIARDNELMMAQDTCFLWQCYNEMDQSSIPGGDESQFLPYVGNVIVSASNSAFESMYPAHPIPPITPESCDVLRTKFDNLTLYIMDINARIALRSTIADIGAEMVQQMKQWIDYWEYLRDFSANAQEVGYYNMLIASFSARIKKIEGTDWAAQTADEQQADAAAMTRNTVLTLAERKGCLWVGEVMSM